MRDGESDLSWVLLANRYVLEGRLVATANELMELVYPMKAVYLYLCVCVCVCVCV